MTKEILRLKAKMAIFMQTAQMMTKNTFSYITIHTSHSYIVHYHDICMMNVMLCEQNNKLALYVIIVALRGTTVSTLHSSGYL